MPGISESWEKRRGWMFSQLRRTQNFIPWKESRALSGFQGGNANNSKMARQMASKMPRQIIQSRGVKPAEPCYLAHWATVGQWKLRGVACYRIQGLLGPLGITIRSEYDLLPVPLDLHAHTSSCYCCCSDHCGSSHASGRIQPTRNFVIWIRPGASGEFDLPGSKGCS